MRVPAKVRLQTRTSLVHVSAVANLSNSTESFGKKVSRKEERSNVVVDAVVVAAVGNSDLMEPCCYCCFPMAGHWPVIVAGGRAGAPDPSIGVLCCC